MLDITLYGIDGTNNGLHFEQTLKSMERCIRVFPYFKHAILFTNFNIKHKDIEIINIEPTTYEYVSYFNFKILNTYVKTNHILHVESDGFIINPNSWTDDFLNYDYIGAPLYGFWDNKALVGNGGFSLRSKKLLEICQKKYPFQDYHYEDKKICHEYRDWFINQDINFAPIELANIFSVDYGVYTNQFGMHGWNNKNIDYVYEQIKQCNYDF